MVEISFEYWNKLAQHNILISSLLGGFSISVIASLLGYESDNKFTSYTLKAATVAAGSFLACLFAWTDILMKTTEGYPVVIVESEIALAKMIGGLTFFLGIAALFFVISLAGWIKSKSTGIFTSAVGLITFLLSLIIMIKISL